MNLFAVYSKTPKGIRKRSSMLVSLLSPTQAKVLAQVDGKATIKMMLNKLDNVNIDDFERAINTLQQNGYIQPVTVEPIEWLPTANFTPMIIEEFSSLDEVAAREQQAKQKETEQKDQQKAEAARARAEAKVKAELEAERKAREAEDAHRKEEAERKAKEAAELKAKQEAEAKAKAAAEEKARLEAERLEAEKRAKEEAERLAAEQKAKEEAERKAKEAAELKAKQEAEAKAKAAAEEKARQEAERLAREAEEARQREEAERKAKAEAEEKARLEAERLEAEKRAKEEAERLAAEQKAKEDAERKAKEEAELKAKQEAEAQARLEAERIARETEEARLKAEAEQKAKEEAERQAREAEEARQREETERKAKAEADAKAKAAAEQKARLEIERITREAKEAKQREEAEKKAKKEAERQAAEQKAREEAELQARQEAEARAKAEAEEQARLEAERQAREAEEARQREESERKAKEEVERLAAEQKVKEEAEEKARLEEAMARMNAEERARAEAEEMARREVERMAQELEAAKQKVEADKKAKKEAEKKAKEETKRLVAEQKAREKAEAKAKAEAEKVRLAEEKAAREAEEAEKKRQVEEKALQAEKLQALIRAEQRQEAAHLRKMDLERAERNALKEEVIVLDAVYDDDDYDEDDNEPAAVDSVMQEMVEDDGFVPTGMDETDEQLPEPEPPEGDEQQKLQALKQAAAAEREHRQRLTLLAKNRMLLRKLKHWLARPARVIKTTLHTASLLVLLLLLVALGMLPYVPLNALVEPAEQLASKQLGAEVKIRRVSAALLPRPHLMLKDMEIGTHGQRIGQVNAWPAIDSLKDDQMVMKALEIHDVKVTHESFGQALDWLNALGNSSRLKIESIRLSKVALSMHDLAMGEFEGEVVQSATHQVQQIQLRSTDQKLQVQITPRGGNAEIALDAHDWALPLQNSIKFRKLVANGMASSDKLQLNQIKAELYEGELAGQMTLSRSKQWDLTGNIRLDKVNAAEVMQAFGSPIKISGQLDAQAALDSHAADANQLAGNTGMSADFNIRHGEIDRLELSRLVLAKRGQSLAGEATRFDNLQGMLQISQQQYRLKNLALSSKQLNARGDMTIAADGEISGNFSASLAAQSRRYSTDAAIGGRGSDIKLR